MSRYKIGVFEEDLENGFCLEKGIKSYFSQYRHLAEISVWSNYDTFLREINEQFCLLFVNMDTTPTMSHKVVQHIRENLGNTMMGIILVSSKSQIDSTALHSHPFDLISLPLNVVGFHDTLQQFFCFDEYDSSLLTFSHFKANNSIPTQQIEYINSNNKYIEIHMHDGHVKRYLGKLSSIIPNLPQHFIQVSKSYIINPKYVISYAAKNIIMADGISIRISGSYKFSSTSPEA